MPHCISYSVAGAITPHPKAIPLDFMQKNKRFASEDIFNQLHHLTQKKINCLVAKAIPMLSN